MVSLGVQPSRRRACNVLQPPGDTLQATGYTIQATPYALQAPSYRSPSYEYKLDPTGYILQAPSYRLHPTGCPSRALPTVIIRPAWPPHLSATGALVDIMGNQTALSQCLHHLAPPPLGSDRALLPGVEPATWSSICVDLHSRSPTRGRVVEYIETNACKTSHKHLPPYFANNC